ncbi:MAG TPA: 5-dehydro-4-deoxy-D-glucuronate isomerase [Bacteroidota bacterium]|nr:5-dehydro-4-deoxy-D-glucuronate isomerase [Bacteroidota bacterium]
MEVRYTADPHATRKLSTEEIRKMFMVDTLFKPGTVAMVYSDVDRSIIGSAAPEGERLKLLSSKKEMAAEYFLERREMGIINIGKDGYVKADGKEYPMAYKDALYIGRGTKEVEFGSRSSKEPAAFYFASYPAHKDFPTVHAAFVDVEHAPMGSVKDSNKRTINKYIHPNGIKSCQLVMGLTELEEGSVWNTMPVHTHQRRSEIYMYFNLAEPAILFHLMGEPGETRHIVVRNRQAVISPSWSIHSGVGTQNYSFIWAMGGENQAFDDMDWVEMKSIG